MIDDASYSGAMPGQATALGEDGIAAVLNYVMGLPYAGQSDPQLQPFTAEEVSAILARYPDATGSAVHQMRAGAWAAAEAK